MKIHIASALKSNGNDQRETILTATEKLLNGMRETDLGELNPTQAYIVMLAVVDSVNLTLRRLEGEYESYSRSQG